MKVITFSLFFALTGHNCQSQNINYLKFPDNLIAEGIPSINAEIVNETKPYTEFRAASLMAVHPKNNQIFISTRFGNTAQIHQVSAPLGSRKQISFFDESPKELLFEIVKANYFLFTKDNGGNEFGQIYRYDVGTSKSTPLTNTPKSQNGNYIFNKSGSQIIYTSTARNNADRDIWTMNPLQPDTKKMIIENKGGGWSIADWSDDEQSILINEGISVSQSNIWLGNYTNQHKSIFISDSGVVYTALEFSHDKNNAYILTNKNSEYAYPALINLISKFNKS